MKSSSLKAVQELQSMGLEVIMLTGIVSKQRKLLPGSWHPKVIAGVLPDGKATAIKGLQEADKKSRSETVSMTRQLWFRQM